MQPCRVRSGPNIISYFSSIYFLLYHIHCNINEHFDLYNQSSLVKCKYFIHDKATFTKIKDENISILD